MEPNCCFICSKDIVGSVGHKTNTRGHNKCNNNMVLKELLKCLSKLLNVPGNTAQDWDYLDDPREQREICCERCYDLLKDVDGVNQVLITTQTLLRKYLDHVETVIVKSEKRQVPQNSRWSSPCFQLRQSVINRVFVKTECNSGHDEQNMILDDDFALYDDDDWKNLILDEAAKSPDTNLLQSIGATTNQETVDGGDEIIGPELKCEYGEIWPSVDEGGSLQSEGKLTQRTCRTRAAKKTAVDALKQYALNSIMPEIDNSILEDEDDYYSDQFVNNNGQESQTSSNSEAGESDKEFELDNKNKKRERKSLPTKSLEDKRQKVNPIHQSLSKDGHGPAKKERKKNCKSDHVPIIVAGDENLYLYHSSTFIRKTYTHLQCKGYHCDFETEWDYYSSFQVMKKHIEDDHLNNKIPHPCILCDVILKTPKDFKTHIQSNHSKYFGPKSFRVICECCLKISSNYMAKGHRFTHKNEAELQAAHAANEIPSEYFQSLRTFACDFPGCGKISQSRKNLKRHKQIHFPPEQRTDLVKCPECGNQMLKESLKLHLKRLHFPELVDTYLVCQYCDKKYMTSDKSSFERHLRQHRGENPFRCEICDASFPSRQYMVAHRNSKHKIEEKKDPIPCEFCGKAYDTTLQLRVHLRRKHREQVTVRPTKSGFYGEQRKPEKVEFGDRLYKCDFEGCDKTFTFKKNRDRHKQTHLPLELRTDQAICPECGKQIQVEALQRHMESQHLIPESMENNLVCPICDKRYLSRDKSMYQSHVRRHRGEKPFLCPECGKSFFDRPTMQAHLKNVHAESEDPIQCQYCDEVYNKKLSLQKHVLRKHADKVTMKKATQKMSTFYYNKEEEQKKKVLIGPIQKYPCYICDKACRSTYVLKRHLSTIHGVGEHPSKYRKPKGFYRKANRKKTATNSGIESQDEAEGRNLRCDVST